MLSAASTAMRTESTAPALRPTSRIWRPRRRPAAPRTRARRPRLHGVGLAEDLDVDEVGLLRGHARILLLGRPARRGPGPACAMRRRISSRSCAQVLRPPGPAPPALRASAGDAPLLLLRGLDASSPASCSRGLHPAQLVLERLVLRRAGASRPPPPSGPSPRAARSGSPSSLSPDLVAARAQRRRHRVHRRLHLVAGQRARGSWNTRRKRQAHAPAGTGGPS